MLVLDAAVCGAFFVGGLLIGAVTVFGLGFTSWCYGWPRGVWK